MRKKQYILVSLGLCGSLQVAGCGTPEDMAPPQITMPTPPPGSTGPLMAFYHEEEVGDVFADGRQLPASLTARLHSCGKVRYSALRNILTTRGVNTASAVADSAGELFTTGNLVLGVANYDARVAESDRNTTGGITRLYDILIAAADEIIAGMPNQAACKVGAASASLFNGDGTCNEDGFTCLLGLPVSQDQLALCNSVVKSPGVLPADSKRLAVAMMAAPIYLCD